MTEQVPHEPEPGTIGAGVVDGDYGDVSSANEIRKCVADYLGRSGLPTTEIELLGTGSPVGGFMESVVQNIWASLAIHAASKFLAFLKGARDRKFEREQNEHLRFCLIQLWDHRGDRSSVIEVLRLLAGLHAHLAQEFPNRNYRFFIKSALQKPKLQDIHVKLEDYDDLGLIARAIARRMSKLSDSEFVFVYLKDGPYYTRPYAFDAV